MTNEAFAQHQANKFGSDFCIIERPNGAVFVWECDVGDDKVIARFKPQPKPDEVEHEEPFRRKHDEKPSE